VTQLVYGSLAQYIYIKSLIYMYLNLLIGFTVR